MIGLFGRGVQLSPISTKMKARSAFIAMLLALFLSDTESFFNTLYYQALTQDFLVAARLFYGGDWQGAR